MHGRSYGKIMECQKRILKEMHTCVVLGVPLRDYVVYFLRRSIVGSPSLEKGVMLGVPSGSDSGSVKENYHHVSQIL
jgi:hypothetical protein